MEPASVEIEDIGSNKTQTSTTKTVEEAKNVDSCSSDQSGGCSSTQCCTDSKEEVSTTSKGNTGSATPSDVCYKCKEEKAVLFIRSDRICKKCFIINIEHRFKSNLRGNLNVLKENVLLVTISSGLNSMAMLRMLKNALTATGNRKIYFTVHLLYIEEAVLYESDPETIQNGNREEMEVVLGELGVPYTILNLQDIFDPTYQDELGNYLQDIQKVNVGEAMAINNAYRAKTRKKMTAEELSNEDTREAYQEALENLGNKFTPEDPIGNIERFKEWFQACGSRGSTMEDFAQNMKQWLILYGARTLKIKKILLGRSGFRSACQLLSQVCKGRGISVPSDISYIDQRFGQIQFLHPMKDFLEKEIFHYSKINDLKSFSRMPLAITKNPKTAVPGNASIDHLIEDFVRTLQAGFPSTVHTILRTGAKLKQKVPEVAKDPICPICHGYRDKVANILEVGSLDFLQSHKEGEQEDGDTEKRYQDQAEILKTLNAKKIYEVHESSDIEKKVCFACRRHIENSDSENLVSKLPRFLLDQTNGIGFADDDDY